MTLNMCAECSSKANTSCCKNLDPTWSFFKYPTDF